ncbi:MAG: hypothetical protein ACRDRV_05760, partial [Pseudonocardiaceae bacterium]
FYPVTPTHAFLRDHLGHERYAGTWGAMGVGADTAARLRALTGHTFVEARLGELVRQVPGTGGLYPTLVNFGATAQAAGSPVLDRLGTRYFVTAPQDQVFGVEQLSGADGSTAVLFPDQPLTVPLSGAGPLRAVGITPAEPVAGPARLDVTVRGQDGREVARNARPGIGAQPFLVPVAAEQVGAGERLTVTLTLRAGRPLPVQGLGGLPALRTIRGAGDGLRIAYAGSAVVYQRLTALPRLRWASDTVVEPDPGRRLARLAAGDLAPGQVLLDAPGPGAGGGPARLEVRTDGPDEIVVDVDAAGAGYLVVADALQTGWAVTVDGAPASLVPADHAVVTVAVPAGAHRVRLHYAAPHRGAGLAVTGVAAIALLGLLAGQRWWTPRR